jgi:DNA polymerase I-like protein with 3'-5' exonuclease and polymerase domains
MQHSGGPSKTKAWEQYPRDCSTFALCKRELLAIRADRRYPKNENKEGNDLKTKKISAISDLPRIEKQDIIIDTETTGLNKMKDTPFLVTITIDDKSWALHPKEAVIWLNDNMPKACFNVFHNAKYDLHMLVNIGLKEKVVDNSNIWCTMVNETLINGNRTSYALDALCKARFNVGKVDNELLERLAAKFGGKPERKAQMNNVSKAPLEMVAHYGCGDTELTKMLFDAQRKEIHEQELERVSRLESNVLKSLVFMERRGVPISVKRVNSVLKEFLILQKKTAEEIENLVGSPVNVKSGKQLKEAFDSLHIPITYSEETGNPTFNKEVLTEMNDDLSQAILKERSYGTMINTFLNKFGEHVYPDGRIRCDFNQTKTDDYGVITGRLSASHPNLMQIPKRDKEKASQVRAVFEAPKGTKWLSADWKQFEFRVFAHYSNDENLLSEFHNNPEADYHQLIADLTSLQRDPYAKQLNLGLVFGMGQGLMAKKCGLPYETKKENGRTYLMAGPKAKAIFGVYHNKLPGVKKMLALAEKTATVRGYVKTIMGRRIRFPNKNMTYKAGGYVFQGSSADLMKQKLVALDKEFRNSPIELVLPVHDEFDFIIHDDLEKGKSKIKEIMQDVPELRVPIRCDIGVGANWWEASK